MVGREVVHWCYLTSGLELRLSSDVVNGVTDGVCPRECYMCSKVHHELWGSGIITVSAILVATCSLQLFSQ